MMNPTNLQQIELENGLSCDLKAAPEKIEAVLEEGPYRLYSRQGESGGDLTLLIRLCERVEQQQEGDAWDSYRELDRSVLGCQ